MKNEMTLRQKLERRFDEELKEIHAEYPDVRSDLVEYQLWLRILHENQSAENLIKN